MNRVEWTPLAAFVLEPALDGAKAGDFEREVNEGICQLWYRDHAYAVTQMKEDESFHVWLVAGRELVEFVSELTRHASLANCKKMTFRTLHPGVVKMTAIVCDRFKLGYPTLTNPEFHEYTVWLQH